ncbi:MAG: hypothetical protein HW405_246 [Candidatus Berkelbacteria bacterium]|nr:hypothetical protein [Candidatus Berkelbacteria bacterium]
MARKVYFLLPRRESYDFRWEECDGQPLIDIRLRQNPHLKIGITAIFAELGDPPYQFPILVRWFSYRQAIIDTNPEPGDESICLLELKDQPDFATLQSCTLEEALALCDTFDTSA